jgi:hypothetical protein
MLKTLRGGSMFRNSNRPHLNQTQDAMLHEIIIGPMTQEEKKINSELQSLFDKLSHPALGKPSTTVARFLWMNLVSELQSLENSEFAREAVRKQRQETDTR